MPIPSEFFLSYSSIDRAFTSRLADVLRAHSIPVWYSGTNIQAAQQWHDEIGAALERCDWVVVVLSPAAVESMWVNRELRYSLQQDRLDGRIVPILHRSCDYNKLSWTLGAIQMVDAQENFEQGCLDLLQIWDVEYAV